MARRRTVLPEWLLIDLRPITGLAAALTGSTPGAAELMATALANDRSWRAAEDGYDLTPQLRTAVVRTFLTSPLGRSRPPATAAGLDALTGPVRTAVVLRDSERLTVGEIAMIMDRPAGRVQADLADQPSGRYEDDVTTVVALAPTPDQLTSRFTEAEATVRRSRRRRRGLLAAVAVAVLAAVVVPTIVLPRLPVHVREPGVWAYSHEVVLAPGWALAGRAIERTSESSVLQIPWVSDDPAICTVTVFTRGVAPERSGDTRPVTVKQRPGEVVTRPGNEISVNWEYASDAWASVGCDSVAAVSESILLQVAAATRFREGRQPLPFTLTSLPADYRIQTVGETYLPSYASVGLGPGVLLVPPDNSYRALVVVGPDLGGSFDDTTKRCLGPQRDVCVSAFQTDDQVPPNASMLRRTVTSTVDDIELAPDPGDRSTWFDATELPG